jgi:hypothetical protein
MTIFQVHVSLKGIDPPIWRRVELSSQTTLKQFHRILQVAMGWEDHHLHEFIVDGQRYGTPDPTYDEPGEVSPEDKTRLSDVLPAPQAELLYIYDFGDYWQHLVCLEQIFPDEPDTEYPRIVSGARSCPPEDCGGTGGYADLLDTLTDPTDEEFDHMRRWVGEQFNAEVFSVQEVDKRLRRGSARSAKK